MALTDRDLAELLAWAAPALRLRDAGFARVRSQVRKRLLRRFAELGLGNVAAYRIRLVQDPAEWQVLDRLCRVTISRFFRDAPAFDHLVEQVLPRLATRAGPKLSAWSMACASGEEPYSLALAWQVRLAPRFRSVALDLLATDASAELLERARRATYPRSILRELPGDLAAVALAGGPALADPRAEFTLPESVRAAVSFQQADVRAFTPPAPFDLILCRNLVFTYFDASLQMEMLDRLARLVKPGAVLMIGKRETCPAHPLWRPCPGPAGFFEPAWLARDDGQP